LFTGIVEELGVVEALEDQGDAIRLTVRGPHVTLDARLGDSISVNGCCLTVAERDGETFTADVMRETLEKTSLGVLDPGSRVNLERAVTAQTRLGGHIVQGHVDGTGTVGSVTGEGFSTVIRVDAPEEILRYVAAKGSVALDGVSLTVAEVGEGWFSVALIPETQERTTLGGLRSGRSVNIEVDVLAKYVERLVTRQ
jgi:riboflavin synthase